MRLKKFFAIKLILFSGNAFFKQLKAIDERERERGREREREGRREREGLCW